MKDALLAVVGFDVGLVAFGFGGSTQEAAGNSVAHSATHGDAADMVITS